MQLLLTLGGRVHRAPRLTWKPQPQGALGSQVPESLSEKRLPDIGSRGLRNPKPLI